MSFATLRRAAALCALASVLPSTAHAQVIDRAVEALREDPVYVDPAAKPRLTEAQANQLRSRITRTNAGPLYIAILRGEARAEAGGDAGEVLRTLVRSLGRRGTYAVVVGGQFRAGATDRSVADLANEAYRANADAGVAATLLDFVERLGAERRGPEPTGQPRPRETEQQEDGGGGGRLLAVLAAIAAGAIGLHAFRRRRRQREELAAVRRAAQEDLLALAEDIRALDLDVEMPGVSREAREQYAHALRRYEEADAALDRARTPDDLEPVTAAIEEGRFAMTSAKAALEGRALPERRPPCFFDPRHGPSDRDVEWAPLDGAPRLVPACEADAQRVERGLEPAAREVVVGGQAMPYWNAPASFGPWAGGYFGGLGGGLLPGLLIGSMLGGGLGLGSPEPAAADSGFDDFGGGDFGGGDFGGGDFGGGDFGGGDFGGGDFGGGDG